MATKKEQTDFSALLPMKPPEGLLEYEPLKQKLKANALIYKIGWCYDPLEERKVQMAEVHCSACGTKFYAPLHRVYGCRWQGEIGWANDRGEVLTSGQNTLCPYCGAEAETYHTSAFGSSKVKLLAKTFPVTFHKIGDHFAICGWSVEKYVNKEGNIEHIIHRYEAYVSDGNKAVKLVGWIQAMMWNVSWLTHWEQRVQCIDSFRDAPVIYEPSLREMIGTEMENSKIDQYIREANGETYPISYMQVYLKHHNVENLVSAGCAELVNKLIEQNLTTNTYKGQRGVKKDLEGIDWKRNRPCEMFRMTKQEFDYFCMQGRDVKAMVIWSKLKKAKVDIHIRDLPEMMKLNPIALDSILEVSNEPQKVFRYLEKQKAKYPKDDADATMFSDYRRMAKTLKEDLQDPKIQFPQRLKRAHDQLVPRIEDMGDQKLAPAFEKQYKKLSKYCFEYDDLLIRPVRTQGELRAEGRILDHCVASYADRHAEGKTAIFLIRQKSNPDVPFFTLEYQNGRVIQNRGRKNRSSTEEVQKFEKEWLAWIAAGMKKKESKKNGKSKQRAAAATAAA